MRNRRGDRQRQPANMRAAGSLLYCTAQCRDNLPSKSKQLDRSDIDNEYKQERNASRLPSLHCRSDTVRKRFISPGAPVSVNVDPNYTTGWGC